ncbi:hypothetical protein KB879_01815 [Cupriavidus sp. KK10]|jgi:hypothetical protein|uniref:hypothetical protein n=1 Tax=Cupriavidus sp. KK10 TaxID=1478019 RepID=UPI001BA5968E|nr:hypothetical protein [Cupriavidus sp. KK10]QUN28736.1 hypothetical protein KB879_01815 [Cupriavidus sp. KK10]
MRERLYTFAVSGAGDMFCHHSVSATSDHRAWRKLIECIDMTATVKVTLIHVEKSQRRAAPADRRMPAAA